MPEPTASVPRIKAAERRRRALELKKAGASYDVIAQTVGYASKSGAYNAVMTALHEIKSEHVEEVRALELLRLDQMLMALWSKITATSSVGDLVAVVSAVLKIMARRAAMTGIDAPTRVDITEDLRRMARDAGLSDEDTEAAVLAAVAITREHAAR